MSITRGPSTLALPHAEDAVPSTLVRRDPTGAIPGVSAEQMVIAQSGGGFGVLIHPVTLSHTTLASVAAANNDFGAPVVLAAGTHITQLGCQVTVPQAGALARVALYASRAGDLYPTTLLAESAALDCSAAGLKLTAIDITIATTGIYWGMYNSNNVLMNVLGINNGLSTPILGISAGGLNQFSMFRARALAAYPTPFPAGGAPAGGNTPLAMFRIEA